MTILTNEIPYPGKIATACVRLTAAKTTEADLTNAELLYTAPPEGALLTKLGALAVATNTACRIKAYLVKSTAPTVPRLKRSRLMLAATINETTAQVEVDFSWASDDPLKLAGGDKLYVALGSAQAGGVDVSAEVEEFVAAP